VCAARGRGRISGESIRPGSELRRDAVGKGNNSQGKEKKKPKKDAKAAPVKPVPPPRKK